MTGIKLLKYFLFTIFIPAGVCTFHKRTENKYVVDEPAHKRNTKSEMQCMHYCQIKQCKIFNMKVLKEGEILCHCHHDHMTTVENPNWIIMEPLSHVYGNPIKPTNPTCIDKGNETVAPNKNLKTYQGETNLQFGYGKNCLLNVNTVSETSSLEFRCDISKGSPIQIFPVMQSDNGNAFQIKSNGKTLTYSSSLNGEKQIGEFTSDQNEGGIFFIEATPNNGNYRISTKCGCYLTVVNTSLSRKATFFKCDINPQESDIFRIEAQSSLKVLDGITSAQIVYKEDCYLLLMDTEKHFNCSKNNGNELEINCNDDGDSCKFKSNGLSLYATVDENSDGENKKLELKEGDGENFTVTYMDGYHRIATWDGCVLTATDSMSSTIANCKCKAVLDNTSLFQIKMADTTRIYSKTGIAEMMYLKFNTNCFMTIEDKSTFFSNIGYDCEGKRDWFEISAVNKSDRYQIKSSTKYLHWHINEQNLIDTEFRDDATNDTYIIRNINGASFQIFTENGCPLISDSILKRLVFSCNHTSNDGLFFEFEIDNLFKIDELIGGKLLQLIWYNGISEKYFMNVYNNPSDSRWNMFFRRDVTSGTKFDILRSGGSLKLYTENRALYWSFSFNKIKNAEFRNSGGGDTFHIWFLSNQSYRILFDSDCFLFVNYVSTSRDNNAEFRCSTTANSENIYTIKVANDEFFAPYVAASALKLAIKINEVMYQMTAIKVSDNVHQMYFSNASSALPLQLVSIPQSNYFQIKSQFGFLFWKRIGGHVKDAEFRLKEYGDDFLIRPSSTSIVKILWRSDCPMSYEQVNGGLFKAVFICKSAPGSGGVELVIT